ncbi:hypothetical protein ABO04_08360 [Nitrosomonas sp. HPC101]|uniref:hypothetical protein n=1 Tax=Nitrosomonas sp. HPC101 TaxID=1658667 RepID=UPI00136DDEF9|nr:hypothetical protein [Nitrosomonas sp. HPC101]MXS85918.1 hypothetical protein [Nitrosomonas sp. HPC101]
MGRAGIFVIFLIGFVVFTLIKMIFVGTKAAYEAVFDPTAKDERVKALIADCMLRVSHIMHEKYTGQPGELSMAILQLTPAVQSMILEKGYQTNAAIARAIVCDAIVIGGHATREEVDRA